jgi:hypothetical protein
MSRHANLALAQLELANVALEDLLLAELKGDVGDLNQVQNQLCGSRASVSRLIASIDDLTTEMDNQNFRDVYVDHLINLNVVGKAFARSGMVSTESWAKVVQNVQTHGFRKNLASIREQAALIAECTDALTQKIYNLREAASQGSVTKVLEENLDGNLKVEFAQLYQAWIKFQGFSLASSLLSSEIHYASEGYGSLLEENTGISTA